MIGLISLFPYVINPTLSIRRHEPVVGKKFNITDKCSARFCPLLHSYVHKQLATNKYSRSVRVHRNTLMRFVINGLQFIGKLIHIVPGCHARNLVVYLVKKRWVLAVWANVDLALLSFVREPFARRNHISAETALISPRLHSSSLCQAIPHPYLLESICN